MDHVEIAGNERGGVGIRGAEALIINSDIHDNIGGGGIVLAGSDVTMIQSFVANNTRSTGAGASGGGLTVTTGAQLTLQESTLANNDNTGGNGGGLFNGGSTAAVFNLFEGNTASNGGGLFNANGSASIVIGNTFLANAVTGGGGGVNNQSTASLEFLSNYLLGNSASGAGGGLSNSGTMDAINLVIAGNTGGSGGGVWNDGTTTLRNTNVYGNTADTFGGGTFNRPGSELTALNSVIWDNVAPTDPNVHFIRGQSTVTLGNTDLQGGLTQGMTNLGDNLDAAPGFVDPSTGRCTTSTSSQTRTSLTGASTATCSPTSTTKTAMAIRPSPQRTTGVPKRTAPRPRLRPPICQCSTACRS